MTAVREDPRAARTRAKLGRALLEECAGHPPTQVSVAALVRRAEVGRATFYLHYADLEALAAAVCADIVREAVDALHTWRGTPAPATPPPALLDFFEDLAPHAGLYRELLGPDGGGPLGRVLHQDRAVEALCAQGASAVWPQCPAHPDAHPLTAAVRTDTAVWVCPRSGTAVARIGELPTR
ncbi:TetR/AcrR family transcriptional regulator [Streptomyces sp. NPDC001678]|uniref:TetR/AcrR family transcriptional regulator n=1 Tax=Streptomyces sp. NPDC001678 TaxID=3364599 RepID=UPI00369C89E6